MKIGVVGSREFKNYAQMERFLDGYLIPDNEIVSGGAKGADSMSHRYALENGYDFHGYYPKKKIYGIPAAYFIRNTLIAENSDVIVAFYQKGYFGVGGTADTVKKAKKRGIEVIEIEEE